MPLISAVGRVVICSISMRPFSPAGVFSPIGPRNFSGVRSSALQVGLDVGRQVVHAVIEAGNGDAAVVVPYGAENFRQQPDRVLRRAAEHAGMQVAVGAGDLHVLIDQSAQRGGDRRRLGVPHGGVADQRQVELELVGIVAHELEQMLRAAFLLALDHGGDRQRQLAGDRLEGAAGLDEGHGLAFVVAGPARDDDLAAAGQRLDARLERRRLPQVQRIDRLHVIMAIEQHARAGDAVRLAHHHRMALGWAHVGGKTDAAQVGGHMLGGGPALFLVRRVGGNRGDAQQRKQALDAFVDILVDAVQDRVECAHDGLLEGWVCKLAMLSG